MRLLVSEYLTSGAANSTPPGESMLSEGRSMLVAISADFARVPGCSVVVTWSADLRPPELPGVQIKLVSSADQERRLFEQLAAECDAAFIIAPETGGILAERRRLVDEAGGRFLGCSHEAIQLCTDKLRLFEHLAEYGIPTIETVLCESISEIPLGRFPIVVKPRDGAGSQDTFLVSSGEELEALCASNGQALKGAIRQPYLPGRPISTGAIVDPTTRRKRSWIRKNSAVPCRAAELLRVQPLPIRRAAVFPAGEQRLTGDGRFHYLGGMIPAAGVPRETVESIVHRTIESIPGLSGYVGFDLVISSEDANDVRLVEINPRLTTSYVGYRALTDDNLAARLLLDSACVDVINWKDETAEFDANGAVRVDSRA